MKANILGTDYTIVVSDLNNYALKDADGITFQYEKNITLRGKEYLLDDADAEELKQARFDDVLRHELFHAFCFESGVDYDEDERLTDFVAKTIPKLERVFYDIKNHLRDEGKL